MKLTEAKLKQMILETLTEDKKPEEKIFSLIEQSLKLNGWGEVEIADKSLYNQAVSLTAGAGILDEVLALFDEYIKEEMKFHTEQASGSTSPYTTTYLRDLNMQFIYIKREFKQAVESEMKLTETKLKQMILDEMKSNLSIADQDQLRADIELVRELSADIDSLRLERDEDNKPNLTLKIDQSIVDKERQILALAKKYNIRHYYDSPGNYDLINLMKKKFRRKSLEESKSREDHMNGAFAAIEMYERGFGGDDPTRNSQKALDALVYSISKGIVACIKEGPSAASLQRELMDKAKELGIFDETMESVLALTKDDVSPEIRLK